MAKNVNYYEQLFKGYDAGTEMSLKKAKDERDALAAETLNKKTMNDILIQNAQNDRANDLFLSRARERALAGDQAGFASEDLLAGRDTSLMQQQYNRDYTKATLGRKTAELPDVIATEGEVAKATMGGALLNARNNQILNKVLTDSPELNDSIRQQAAKMQLLAIPADKIAATLGLPQDMFTANPGAQGAVTLYDPVGTAKTNVANATAFTTKTVERDAEQANKIALLNASTQGRIETDTAKTVNKAAATTTKPGAAATGTVSSVRAVPAQEAPAETPAKPATVAGAPAPAPATVAPAVAPAQAAAPQVADFTASAFATLRNQKAEVANAQAKLDSQFEAAALAELGNARGLDRARLQDQLVDAKKRNSPEYQTVMKSLQTLMDLERQYYGPRR